MNYRWWSCLMWRWGFKVGPLSVDWDADGFDICFQGKHVIGAFWHPLQFFRIH